MGRNLRKRNLNIYPKTATSSCHYSAPHEPYCNTILDIYPRTYIYAVQCPTMKQTTWFHRSSVKRHLSLQTNRKNLNRISFNKILYSPYYGPDSVSLKSPLPERKTRAGVSTCLSLHGYLCKIEFPLDQRALRKMKKKKKMEVKFFIMLYYTF